ncbi:MAG: GHKL domain-containing protein, partial [Candidatus Lokiarchaeota archaeon]|nr:GHKL domain-containing protein [Candidatus Lokiarchaeota archaeon]
LEYQKKIYNINNINKINHNGLIIIIENDRFMIETIKNRVINITKKKKTEFLIMLCLMIISFFLEILFIFYFSTDIVFSHFFYAPIILACIWWRKKGLFIPLILSLSLLIFPAFSKTNTLEIINLDNIFRVVLLNGIGIVVSFLSENLHKTQERMSNYLSQLEKSNADLEEFAYIASHDLQEPLRAIISFSQLLESDYKDVIDEVGKEYLDFIVEGGNRMKLLITELLEYSRITTRKRPLSACNTESVLEESMLNLKESIRESKAVITHDRLPEIVVDKSQILRVFQNLIGNAIKFRSDKDPRIHVSAQKNFEEVVFSIKDNGIGIDSKYYDRIFKIFQRLHTKSEYEGSGVGLAICKKIIQGYGGNIWVESKLGEGSTFYFSLPLKKGF